MKYPRMNKKAFELLTENIVFVVLIILFFGVMFVFVSRAGNQSSIIEQSYSKQIALLIDKAKTGTIINLDISELTEFAKKNNFNGRIIEIDNLNKKVVVRASDGKGYSFNFFSDAEIIWDLKSEKENEKLYMEIR
jgi:hypothetical protein